MCYVICQIRVVGGYISMFSIPSRKLDYVDHPRIADEYVSPLLQTENGIAPTTQLL